MAYKITEADYNKLSADEQEKYTKRGKIRTKLKKFLTNEEKEEFNQTCKEIFKRLSEEAKNKL